VAANATLGVAAQIPLGDLAVRRSVTFAPMASAAISFAKFGHEVGGPVDRRVVVNHAQARTLLSAVRSAYPSLEAYFACLYYAGLRPAEARHLRVRDCVLPKSGWGQLILVGSTPDSNGAWTDSGQANEDRQLKHRGVSDTRPVPASPELVEILRQHIATFPTSPGGRLFVTRIGPAGVPLPPPFNKPLRMGTAYRVWDTARAAAFTEVEYASPLARRPYDLRHAALSTWLNAGVPPTQVAEWAGHSVMVLLRVYAKWRKTYSKTYSEWAGALSGFLPQISGFEAKGLRPQTARRSRAVLCSQEALHAGCDLALASLSSEHRLLQLTPVHGVPRRPDCLRARASEDRRIHSTCWSPLIHPAARSRAL